MTTFRDDDDSAFQTHIDGLTHSSISTKLSVIEALETQLQSEQRAAGAGLCVWRPDPRKCCFENR